MVEDRGPQVAIVFSLFLVFSWIFVCTRFYVKLVVTRCWGADDWILLLALHAYTVYSVLAVIGVKYGTGRHLDDIPPKDVPQALHYWYLCELIYTFVTFLVRSSIGIFLLRISVRRVHKCIIWTTMIAVAISSVVFFFIILFQCSPPNFFWKQYLGEEGHCGNIALVPDMAIAYSGLSFLVDWIFGLLPIALVWHLKLDRRNKLSIAALLSLGLLAGVATIIRIPFIRVLQITDDFLFATTDVAIWSTSEPGLGLIAASGATLRPLFRRFFNLTGIDGLTMSINIDDLPNSSIPTTSPSFKKTTTHTSSSEPGALIKLQQITKAHSPVAGYFENVEEKERKIRKGVEKGKGLERQDLEGGIERHNLGND